MADTCSNIPGTPGTSTPFSGKSFVRNVQDKDPGNDHQNAWSARKQIWFAKIPSAHFSQARPIPDQAKWGATTEPGSLPTPLLISHTVSALPEFIIGRCVGM
jgi:hypothetical protein